MGLRLALQLLDTEVISTLQFIELIENYESSASPEIAIALSYNFVTVQQAHQALKFIDESAGRTFCVVAQKLGMLNENQIEEIHKIQDTTRRGIDRIVVDLGMLSKSQVNALARTETHSSLPSPKFSRRARHASSGNRSASIR